MYELQGLKFITVKSNALKGRGDIVVFVPQEINNKKDIPVCILLHGVYGSGWSWAFQGGIHQTASRLIHDKEIDPMIIAMPSDGLWGDGSAYLPHRHKNFETWIAQDVPDALMEVFPQVSKQSSFFIGGLSMGGFGALHIGAKYHHLFRGISAHSSITRLEQMKLFSEEKISEDIKTPDNDLCVIDTIDRYKNNLPPLRFDCGKEDLLTEANRELHLELKQKNIQHVYEEFPGGHTWQYWQKHVAKSLKFFDAINPAQDRR